MKTIKSSKKSIFFSIVILNYNRKRDVLELIKSLLAQTYKNFEIIVADNASTDGSAKAVKKKYPGIKYIVLSKNIGRAGHNEGAKKAKADILVFFDADMYFPKDFLRKVASKFKSMKDLDAASFRMIDPKNKNRRWVAVHTKEGSDKKGYESTFGGGMWAIRRKVFEDIGGFNLDFFVYVDEWEYVIRLWRKGYSVRYFPDLVGYHKESPYAYRSVMKGYHVIVNHAQMYALYLPVRLWPRFLKHHSSETSRILIKGEANRWGTIKGLVMAGFYFLKALPKRQVLRGEALQKFLRFYFPKKGDVVIEMWGWY